MRSSCRFIPSKGINDEDVGGQLPISVEVYARVYESRRVIEWELVSNLNLYRTFFAFIFKKTMTASESFHKLELEEDVRRRYRF